MATYTVQGTTLTSVSPKNLTFYDISSLAITTISSQAFSGCTNLTSIKFPVSLTTIQGFTFTGTIIQDLDLSGTGITALVTLAGTSIFNTFTLKSLNLSNTSSLTTIERTFRSCPNLESVNLTGSGLKIIDFSAFYNCTKLNSITFPLLLESIGSQAFYNCTSLLSANVPSTTSIASDAFPSTTTITRISSLTLTPNTSDYYTGSPSTPTTTVTGNLYFPLTYEYRYDGSSTIPNAPRTYTLSVIATGPNVQNYAITYNTSTFKVLALPLTIRPTMSDYYSGSPSTPTSTVTGNLTDAITYEYKYNDSSLPPIDPRTNNTLSVIATVQNAFKYNITYETHTFAVLPASITTVVFVPDYVIGSPSTPIPKYNTLITGHSISSYNYNYGTTLPNVVGTFKATFLPTITYGTSNVTYMYSFKPIETEFTVLPITAEINPFMKDYVSGSPTNPSVTICGSLPNSTIYSYKYNGSDAKPITPGQYELTVTATIQDSANYSVTYKPYTFTVLPKTVYTSVQVSDFIVGSPSTPKFTHTDLIGTDSIASYTTNYKSTTYDSSDMPTEAGNYTVTATPTITNRNAYYNHIALESKFQILKIPLTITPVTPNVLSGSPLVTIPTAPELEDGDIPDYTFFREPGVILAAGEYTQRVLSVIIRKGTQDVTSKYNPTFIDTPFYVKIPLTITSTMDSYTYGDDPRPTGNSIVVPPVAGLQHTYTYGKGSAPPEKVGAYVLSETARIVYNGEDITSHYAITNEKGIFRVLPIKIILKVVMIDDVPSVIQTGELKLGDTLETVFKYGNSTERPTTGRHIVSVKGKVKSGLVYVTSNYNIICHSCVYKP